MKSSNLLSEIKKINKTFIVLSIISIFLSVFVLNLIYSYDNSFIHIRNTMLTDYIQVNNILSGQVALFMPILIIIMAAFIWTIDFESGCITYILLGVTRKNWAIVKVIVCILVTIFFYLILGIGLTIFSILLGNNINLSYLGDFLLLIGAGIPMIIWILFVGIVAMDCKEFGKTVAGSLGLFLISYVIENYFAKMKGFFPTSAIIYIWGYNDKDLFFKNIVNFIFYTCILTVILVLKVKKKEI